jgi:hypothetical protein
VLSFSATPAGSDPLGHVSTACIRLKTYLIPYQALKTRYDDLDTSIFDRPGDAAGVLHDTRLVCASIRSRVYNSANPSHLNGETKECLILVPASGLPPAATPAAVSTSAVGRKGKQKEHEQENLYRRVGFWSLKTTLPRKGPAYCPDCDLCSSPAWARFEAKLKSWRPADEEIREREAEARVGYEGWEEREIVIV